jgi:hypothetical protein
VLGTAANGRCRCRFTSLQAFKTSSGCWGQPSAILSRAWSTGSDFKCWRTFQKYLLFFAPHPPKNRKNGDFSTRPFLFRPTFMLRTGSNIHELKTIFTFPVLPMTSFFNDFVNHHSRFESILGREDAEKLEHRQVCWPRTRSLATVDHWQFKGVGCRTQVLSDGKYIADIK